MENDLLEFRKILDDLVNGDQKRVETASQIYQILETQQLTKLINLHFQNILSNDQKYCKFSLVYLGRLISQNNDFFKLVDPISIQHFFKEELVKCNNLDLVPHFSHILFLLFTRSKINSFDFLTSIFQLQSQIATITALDVIPKCLKFKILNESIPSIIQIIYQFINIPNIQYFPYLWHIFLSLHDIPVEEKTNFSSYFFPLIFDISKSPDNSQTLKFIYQTLSDYPIPSDPYSNQQGLILLMKSICIILNGPDYDIQLKKYCFSILSNLIDIKQQTIDRTIISQFFPDIFQLFFNLMSDFDINQIPNPYDDSLRRYAEIAMQDLLNFSSNFRDFFQAFPNIVEQLIRSNSIQDCRNVLILYENAAYIEYQEGTDIFSSLNQENIINYIFTVTRSQNPISIRYQAFKTLIQILKCVSLYNNDQKFIGLFSVIIQDIQIETNPDIILLLLKVIKYYLSNLWKYIPQDELFKHSMNDIISHIFSDDIHLVKSSFSILSTILNKSQDEELKQKFQQLLPQIIERSFSQDIELFLSIIKYSYSTFPDIIQRFIPFILDLDFNSLSYKSLDIIQYIINKGCMQIKSFYPQIFDIFLKLLSTPIHMQELFSQEDILDNFSQGIFKDPKTDQIYLFSVEELHMKESLFNTLTKLINCLSQEEIEILIPYQNQILNSIFIQEKGIEIIEILIPVFEFVCSTLMKFSFSESPDFLQFLARLITQISQLFKIWSNPENPSSLTRFYASESLLLQFIFQMKLSAEFVENLIKPHITLLFFSFNEFIKYPKDMEDNYELGMIISYFLNICQILKSINPHFLLDKLIQYGENFENEYIPIFAQMIDIDNFPPLQFNFLLSRISSHEIFVALPCNLCCQSIASIALRNKAPPEFWEIISNEMNNIEELFHNNKSEIINPYSIIWLFIFYATHDENFLDRFMHNQPCVQFDFSNQFKSEIAQLLTHLLSQNIINKPGSEYFLINLFCQLIIQLSNFDPCVELRNYISQQFQSNPTLVQTIARIQKIELDSLLEITKKNSYSE